MACFIIYTVSASMIPRSLGAKAKFLLLLSLKIDASL